MLRIVDVNVRADNSPPAPTRPAEKVEGVNNLIASEFFPYLRHRVPTHVERMQHHVSSGRSIACVFECGLISLKSRESRKHSDKPVGYRPANALVLDAMLRTVA